jgi:hypothetical protein
MNRQKLVRLFVLMEISDDYEEPEHIYRSVAKRAAICGVDVSEEDVRKSLRDLVGSGLAKAYELSTREPFAQEIEGWPSLGCFQDYYFWITTEGKGALSILRDQSSLDDEDGLAPGWSAPTE